MATKNESEIKWMFDEIGLITQTSDIIRESFSQIGFCNTLIREVIQNSLDARLPGKQLKMVFSFNEIDKKDISDYIGSLIPHLTADRFAQKGKVIEDETILTDLASDDPVLMLCIDDLETTGLDGETMSLGEDSSSNFTSFFRAEGISSKQGSQGGRWGQGKTTLNMASHISTFWGLTRRHSDSKELLMGKALLSPHILQSVRYRNYGLFMNSDESPISDRIYIKDFKRKMKCGRLSKESGLSLLIPYPVEVLTFESIIKSSIINYFFPLIKKDLTIKIRSIDNEIHDISDQSIVRLVKNLDWSETLWEKKSIEENLEIINFSKECVELYKQNELVNISQKAADEYTISMDIVEESCNIGEKMLQFNNGKLLGFKIPVNISHKELGVKKSFFEVYIKKYPADKMSKSDEHIYRSGLSLTKEEKKLGGLPVRGILNADDEIISEFLGDAETPSHLKWNRETELLIKKYDKHRQTLSYIRNAMKNLVKILDLKTKDKDYDLLSHIFSLPENVKDEDQNQGERSRDDNIESDGPPPDPLPDSTQDIKIEKIPYGVAIKGSSKTTYPNRIRLKLAYDVLRGSAFSSYKLFDFDLGADILKISPNQCKILHLDSNQVEFELKNRNSNLRITGFDQDRDLVVNLEKVKK
jgi:hypothetical protein